jgi:hypothetical protein
VEAVAAAEGSRSWWAGRDSSWMWSYAMSMLLAAKTGVRVMRGLQTSAAVEYVVVCILGVKKLN